MISFYQSFPLNQKQHWPPTLPKLRNHITSQWRNHQIRLVTQINQQKVSNSWISFYANPNRNSHKSKHTPIIQIASKWKTKINLRFNSHHITIGDWNHRILKSENEIEMWNTSRAAIATEQWDWTEESHPRERIRVRVPYVTKRERREELGFVALCNWECRTYWSFSNFLWGHFCPTKNVAQLAEKLRIGESENCSFRKSSTESSNVCKSWKNIHP